MIKIIESNKTIYLIDNQSDFKRSENAVIVSVQSADEMISNYNKLAKKKKLQEIYFFNRDLKQLYNYFSAMFRIIEAAGGLVKNKKNEWLFIFRNGKWDLPKGKIENGEGIKASIGTGIM